MAKTPVHKLILRLDLPTTVSMLITDIYNLADMLSELISIPFVIKFLQHDYSAEEKEYAKLLDAE